MALSDLAVFSETAYKAMTEIVAQQVDLFNAASRGTIVLSPAANQGDYSDKAFFGKISGLVRRRDAYGSGAVAAKNLAHLVDTMVKIAAGTPPVALDPGQFKWIQLNPQVAGAALGQQLAKDMLADMLNIGGAAAYAALSGQAADIQYDGTGDTPDTLSPAILNLAASKFGDRSSEIVAWLVHSYNLHNFYANAIANTAQLFTYGTVNVMGDPFGRVFVVSDIPALFTAGSPNIGYTLGLTAGAINIEQNSDYTENITTTNGDENIGRSFQAEWSYNLGIKGFAWDKANGGKSPNDAALVTATNWDKIVTSKKDLAGVIAKTN